MGSMICGVNLQDKKHVVIALQGITGIGKSTALLICAGTNINPHEKFANLSEQQKDDIRNFIKDQGYLVEGNLRRFVAESIKSLMDVGCLRGRRHRAGLPVRGQRTKTNAKTARKKNRRGDK